MQDCCRTPTNSEGTTQSVNAEHERSRDNEPSADISIRAGEIIFTLIEPLSQPSQVRGVAPATALTLEILDGPQKDIGTNVHITPHGLTKSTQRIIEQTVALDTEAQLLDVKYNLPSSSYYIKERVALDQLYFRVDGSHSLVARQLVGFCDNLVSVEVNQAM